MDVPAGLAGDVPVPKDDAVPAVVRYFTSDEEIRKPGPEREVPVPPPSAIISRMDVEEFRVYVTSMFIFLSTDPKVPVLAILLWSDVPVSPADIFWTLNPVRALGLLQFVKSYSVLVVLPMEVTVMAVVPQLLRLVRANAAEAVELSDFFLSAQANNPTKRIISKIFVISFIFLS